MRGWLLDTNVISELRKARADAGVTAFVEAQPGDLLYVSAITFGEIRYGIEQIEDPARRADIEFWLDHTIRPLFAGRVTPVSEEVIVRWKMMVVDGQKRGHTFGQPDLFIAATAALEDLIVVSRDITQFVAAGAPVFDPWTSVLHARGKTFPIHSPARAEAVAAALGKRRR
ncbi:MAG: type II toxin-antitoxin system VapC family toxin [Alphaproteobacteria bacterium]|nr:type II toxin-antitoxin system VapC family toxin [Alphaproteobacteria bacterium]